MTENFYAIFCVECDKRLHCLLAGGCIASHRRLGAWDRWVLSIGQKTDNTFMWLIRPQDLDKLPPTMKVITTSLSGREAIDGPESLYTVDEFREQITGKCSEHIYKS